MASLLKCRSNVSAEGRKGMPVCLREKTVVFHNKLVISEWVKKRQIKKDKGSCRKFVEKKSWERYFMYD